MSPRSSKFRGKVKLYYGEFLNWDLSVLFLMEGWGEIAELLA